MRILIATHNPSKAREMTDVLSGFSANLSGGIEWVRLDQLTVRIAEPVEDGRTFEANATLKARYYARASGLVALADDSGLEVDALGGRPGVDSAYYDEAFAGAARAERDRANNAKLMRALACVTEERRTARFRCCLALADGDDVLHIAHGAVEGVILSAPRGTGGFGYDPYFFIPELGKTTAELTSDEKNRVSHRGKALRAMGEWLRSPQAERLQRADC